MALGNRPIKEEKRMKEMINYDLAAYIQCLKAAGLLVNYDLKGQDQSVVKGLTYNSKAVAGGTLFICKGASFKEDYLKEALARGAVAYVSETAYDVSAPYILVSDIRKAMPFMANLYFCRPWEDLNLIGITGTKGKSTTAYYIKAIIDDYMAAAGKKESGVISSIDVYDGVVQKESHITTPEAVELMEHFRNAVDSGIDYMEMEVSSQALKYDRVDQITFDVGVFLNISEDHISPIEHPDFNDYFESKLRIFAQTKTACVNLDSDESGRIMEAAQAAGKVITFGTDKAADIRADRIRKKGMDTVFQVSCDRFDREFVLEMPGLFNVENALAAIAIAYALDIPVEYMYSGLKRARSSGRMELYHSQDHKIVAIVDYAHNKLSFEKLFESTLEEYKGRRIVTIFGCPGKKAYIRRRDLGTAAGKYSDKIYLVAEDPGYEPVEDISRDIARYVEAQGCPYEMIEDRGEAIGKAIMETTEPTVILITGKGNETRQKYGSEYIDCPSDVEYTKKFIGEYDRVHGE